MANSEGKLSGGLILFLILQLLTNILGISFAIYYVVWSEGQNYRVRTSTSVRVAICFVVQSILQIVRCFARCFILPRIKNESSRQHKLFYFSSYPNTLLVVVVSTALIVFLGKDMVTDESPGAFLMVLAVLAPAVASFSHGTIAFHPPTKNI